MDSVESHIVRSDSAIRQADALAADVAQKLQTAIDRTGQASVAFSGGSTPALFLKHLSLRPVDWSKVHITLVDERCVSESDERSNARMLRANLLDNLPVEPRYAPLFLPNENESDRDARLNDFQSPFDVVHLGMGEDAHTASFFPDAENIGDMLDLSQTRRLLKTQSAASREERITWSLAALLQTRFMALQISGARKWTVLSDALESLAQDRLDEEQRCQKPILAVLEQTQVKCPDGVPAKIYYASE